MLRSYVALATAAGITVYFAHLSFLAIMANHDLAGGALGTVDIAALASTFIIGSRILAKKNEAEPQAEAADNEDTKDNRDATTS